MVTMPDATETDLGTVQRTLFFPLLARARETVRRRPLLRDPTAVELVHAIDFDYARYSAPLAGRVVVLRTLTFDWWVRQFLAGYPGGTVVELGTGLNTRFERTDNGSVRWIDLDLPDTVALRRRYFADTGRRRLVAASLLDEGWLDEVAASPGPYFFVAEGVLTYLTEAEATGALARIAARFPGARLAFDTSTARSLANEHKMAAKRDIARWQWACDDPRTLEPLGLRLLDTATVTRPVAGVRAELPLRTRLLLPLADPVLGSGFTKLSLFAAGPV